MHGERDALVKFVFPELRRRGQNQNIQKLLSGLMAQIISYKF
jgi:hypothetical protein